MEGGRATTHQLTRQTDACSHGMDILVGENIQDK
jgi:hypothetical protein